MGLGLAYAGTRKEEVSAHKTGAKSSTHLHATDF